MKADEMPGEGWPGAEIYQVSRQDTQFEANPISYLPLFKVYPMVGAGELQEQLEDPKV